MVFVTFHIGKDKSKQSLTNEILTRFVKITTRLGWNAVSMRHDHSLVVDRILKEINLCLLRWFINAPVSFHQYRTC